MRTFTIITEADARVLERGSTVTLAPGGHITPLAHDTLRERRVTVVCAVAGSGGGIACAGGGCQARRSRRRPHVGSAEEPPARHAARAGLAVADVGTDTADAVDYPDIAAQVARLVARREADAGIVIDGAGLGSAIAANKIHGIRAAMCTTKTLARYAREHNGANVLALGATLLTPTRRWRSSTRSWRTPMREARYIRRLAKIRRAGATELQRDRLIAAGDRTDSRGAGGRAGAVAPARCACHGFTYECCPDRRARRARCRRDAARSARRPAAATGGVAATDRSHAAQAGRHAPATSTSCAAKRRSGSSRLSASIPRGWRTPHGGSAAAASASARSSAFRSAPRRPTSSSTKRGGRSSTARPRSTWSSTSAR